MNKRLIIILALVGVLIVAALIWLIASGQVIISWKNGTSQSSASSVCKTDTVDSYNKAAYYQVREGSELPTADEASLKKITSDIKAKNGYDSDPTCQAILFWNAILASDYEGAKKAHEIVKDLHGRGIFADSNIRNNAPLFEYESALRDISPNLDTEGSAGDDE